jgi:hypothetical protein
VYGFTQPGKAADINACRAVVRTDPTLYASRLLRNHATFSPRLMMSDFSPEELLDIDHKSKSLILVPIWVAVQAFPVNPTIDIVSMLFFHLLLVVATITGPCRTTARVAGSALAVRPTVVQGE